MFVQNFKSERNSISSSLATFLVSLETMRLEANRLEDRVADEICNLREDVLSVFVVDCPIEISGDSGTETFGVVCSVPQCCTECVDQ